MSPFNPKSWFNRRSPQNSPETTAKEENQQTFILEPIYTPSGFADGGDDPDAGDLSPIDDPMDDLGDDLGDDLDGESDVSGDDGDNIGDDGENIEGDAENIIPEGEEDVGDVDNEYIPDNEIGETIPYAEDEEDPTQTQDSGEDGEASLGGDADIPDDDGETNDGEVGEVTEDESPDSEETSGEDDTDNDQAENEVEDNPEDDTDNDQAENELEDNPEDDTDNPSDAENSQETDEEAVDVDNSEEGDSETDNEAEDDLEDDDDNPLAFDVPEFNSGIFQVGNSGEVGVDFLFDGGRYQGEVAFFSLAGFNELEFNSIEDFIAEAAQRAASGSEQGHIVIRVADEGARFTGSLFGEPNWNTGVYEGVKTFNMTPGDEFGVMLVPNGRVSDVLDNPSLGGATRPLFSLASSNPREGFHLGQIADLTGDGNTFVFEDKRVEVSDWDYDDVIFQIRGAVGNAVHVDDVIDPDLDWRQDDLGKALLAYSKPYLATREQLDLAELVAQEFDGVVDGDDDLSSPDSDNPDLDNPDLEGEELDEADADLDEVDQADALDEADDGDSQESPSDSDSLEEDEAVESSGESSSTSGDSSSNSPSNPDSSSTSGGSETVSETQPSSEESQVTSVDNSTETVTEEDASEGSESSEEVAEAQQEPVSEEPVSEEPVSDNPVSENEVDGSSNGSSNGSSEDTADSQTADPLVTVAKGFEFAEENQPLVGIIDTGFAENNPDLDYDKVILGRDWVDGDDNPLLAPGEGSEHGTHLLGLIAAGVDNGIGIDGINPEAPVWLGRGVGSGEWASSLVEFVDAAAESGQANAVVNLSLDLTEMDAEGNVSPRYELTVAERTAIEYARQQGVLLVVAAGNDGGNLSALAQASREFDNVLTVGAAEAFDPNLAVAEGHGRAEYSNFGTGLGLLAPGGTAENPVLSTVGDDLGTLAGTSVATARVTGATSVVWAANPELSYRQVIEILQSTATDLGTPNWNPDTGAGLLNLLAAVHLAKATKPQDYDPTPIEIGETPRRQHIVQPGETPAGLAEEELGDEEAWVEITDSEGNPFESPDEPLVPGTVVELPMYGEGVVNPQVESPAREPQPLTPANQEPEDLRLALNRLYNPGETIRIPGRVLDEDGAKDIERVEFWLKSGDGDWVPYPELVHFSEDRRNDQVARFEYELEGLEPGKYQLKATAYDSEGQTAEFESDRFTILSVDEGQELSPILKTAIEEAMNLDSYDPERLAETRRWVVSVQAGTSATEIADQVGASLEGATGQIPNTYIFDFPEGHDPHEVAQQLQGVEAIEFAYPLVPVSLTLLSHPTENNFFHKQWSLENTEVPGQDLNLLGAWDRHESVLDYSLTSGNQVVIGIVDDGVQYDHPDLVGRYRDDLSWDFTDNDSDASPWATNVFDVNLSNPEITGSGLKFTLPVSLTGLVTETQVKIDLPEALPAGFSVYLAKEGEGDPDPRNRRGSRRFRRFLGWDDIYSPTSTKLFDAEDTKNQLSFELTGEDLGYFDGKFSGGNWSLKIVDESYRNTDKLKDLSQQIIDDWNWQLELSTANPHGTAVAGIALASSNGVMTGVNPYSQLAGLRLIGDTNGVGSDSDGQKISSALFDTSLMSRNEEIDIFNNSWGLNYLDRIPLALAAFENGVKTGRNQLGNAYVFASGNDGYGEHSGNVNYNSLANSRHTIAVAAVDHEGKRAEYSTPGSSVFISSYSDNGVASDDGFRGIFTTDLTGGHGYKEGWYNEDFGGTSASASALSGVVSWLLLIYPELTSREIQHILVDMARKNDPDDPDWVQNGAGHWVNHKYGFGVPDLHDVVERVRFLRSWNKPLKTEADLLADSLLGQYRNALLDLPIPDYDLEGIQDSIEVRENRTLEWVEVTVDIEHSYRGDLKIVLTSPDGTESVLAQPHLSPADASGADYNQWVFTTARHWGESSQGEWTLQVIDEYGNPEKNDTGGILKSWSLDLYGSKAEVSLETRDSNASQDGNAGSFVISRTGNTREPLTVQYEISGDAVNGVDYKELSGTVTFPEGKSQVSLPVVPLYHYNLEGEKTVEINLSPDEDIYKLNPEQAQGVVKVSERTRKSGVPPQIHINPETGNLYFLSEKETWLGAQAQAEAWGGNLVSITSESEQIWLEETFGTNEVFHIGLTDSEIYEQTEGDWAWVNGDPVTYENWKPGEPNNWRFLPEGEDFGVMNQHVPGQWNDRTHRGSFAGIIEVDPTTLDQPILNVRVLEHLAEGENSPGEVAFIRAGDLSEDLVVQYELAGEAENGIDYNELTGEITIPAGEVMATLPIIPITENIQKTGDHIMVRLADGDYDLGTHRVGRVTITEPISDESWIRQLGSPEMDQGNGVAVDADGNVYVVGVTRGSLDGNVNAGGVEPNWADPFMTKYDAEGNKLWTRQMGTTGWDYYNDVIVADDGSIYTLGYADGEGTTGYGDGHLSKWDSDGNQIWKKFIGDADHQEFLHNLAEDKYGNVYVTGFKQIRNDNNSSNGLVIKYDSDGREIWTNEIDSGTVDRAREIKLDSQGNVYVVGRTEGSLDGNSSSGGSDVFLVKYDSHGNHIWTEQLEAKVEESPGKYNQGTMGLVIDEHDNIYISGYTDGEFPGQTHSGTSDTFVARYDTEGSLVWLRQLGTEDNEVESGLVIDGDGNLNLIGRTRELWGDETHSGGHDYDVYITKLDPDGNLGSTHVLGTNRDDTVRGITSDRNGNIYVSGFTWGAFEGENAGHPDFWVAKNPTQLSESYNWDRTYLGGNSDTEPHGDEFQVNTHTDGNQSQSSVTNLADGGFVVTWHSEGQDGSGYGVYGQRYDSDGNPVGSEFHINTYAYWDQSEPSVTGLADGDFVVTWQSEEQDSSGRGVYGQRYNSDGNRVGSEFQINTHTNSHQWRPSVTDLADGGFVVTWNSDGQDGSGRGVYGQRYDSDGNQVGSEFQVNTYTHSYQSVPSVTDLADGGFVVTWSSYFQDGSEHGVYGQRYDSDGNSVGSEFQVNTYTDDRQEWPSVTGLSNGGFVVTWASRGQDGSGDGIYAQRYDSDGNRVGSEFQVNTYTDGNHYKSSVIGLADGGFVMTWTSSSNQDGSWAGVYSQRYDSDGNPVGSEFQVNTYTDSYQWNPSVTGLSDGRFVVTWTSQHQDGSGDGIYGQIFGADGTNPKQGGDNTDDVDDDGDDNVEVKEPTVAPASPTNLSSERNGNSMIFSWEAPTDAETSQGDLTYNLRVGTTPGGSDIVNAIRQEAEQGNVGTSTSFTLENILDKLEPGAYYWAVQTVDGNLTSSDFASEQSFTVERPVIKVGEEFQVNTYTDSDQWYSSVTDLADGGFVVTWHSEGQDSSEYGVYGQRYDSDGNPVGSEFHINTYTDGDQWYPSVTGLADGSFVVTWYSEGQDGSGYGVYGQRYDSDGNQVGSEFHINTYSNNHQRHPSVTDLADGDFVVTWQSEVQDGSGRGIYGQRYDSHGNRVGSEFQVNTHTHSYQSVPSVTDLADGGFVVTWSSYLQDGSEHGVYGQRYDSNGNVVGSEFQVNTYTDDRQDWPSVTGLSNGGFVVTWNSQEQDGSGYGIYAQRYDSDGNPVGSEFKVNTYTDNNQWRSSVTNLTDGGFVVTWQSEGQDGSARSVYGQRYDSDGNRVGFEFKVNTYINNRQGRPSVTSLSDGRFVVTWTSQIQDGSGYGIYGQIFDTPGITEVTTPTPVTLEVLDGEATQDGNAAVFAVTREENLDQSLQVNYEISGSAINGVDYQSISETVTFEPGQRKTTISIIPNYNLFNSDDESFEISLTSGDSYEVTGTFTGTATIANSPVIEHYGSFIYQNPDTGNLYVLTEPDTWYGSQAQAEALGGNLVTINNQAEQDWLSDSFGDQNNFWIDQGKWNDLNSQESEHFGIAEINPNDLEKPIVTMMATDATAGEDGNAGQLVIQRFDDVSEELTVSLSVTGPANPGVDYQPLPEQVTIPAGELLVTVPIFGLPDDIPNNDTFFRVMIGEDDNYEIAPLSSAEISIIDQHPLNRVANEVIGRDLHSLDYWIERWENGESLEDLRPEIIRSTDNNETVITELTALYQSLLERNPTSVELHEAQQYLGNGGTLPELRQLLEGVDTEDWIQSPNYVYTNPDTGKRYTLTQLDTWLGAQEQAKAMGGNLVTIDSESENQWLLNKFGQTYNTWIGFNDSPIYGNREGEFTWVSGDPVVYTNWHPSEPNNVQRLSQEGEDFVEMFRNKPWNDMPSNPTFLNLTYRPGIVEFPDSSSLPVDDSVSDPEVTVEAYFAEDIHTEGNEVRMEDSPKTDQARAEFLENLINLEKVDFEEFENFSRPQVLDFGDTTATLSYMGDLMVETLVEGTNGGMFPTSGKNYLMSRNDTEFTIEFSKPQSAFGLNITDAEGSPFSMTLHREDGTTKNVVIPVEANYIDFSGSVLFFGVKDAETPFNAVTIHKPGDTERIGLDELVIGEIKP